MPNWHAGALADCTGLVAILMAWRIISGSFIMCAISGLASIICSQPGPCCCA